MKKIATLTLAALCLSAFSSLALAAKPGYYLGAGIGGSRLETPNQNLITGAEANTPGLKQSHDRQGFAGRVFGGYNFNEYVGVEAGLAKYGDAQYKSSLPNNLYNAKVTYSYAAVDAVVKGYLPIASSGFNVYGLGGVAYVNSKFVGSESGPVAVAPSSLSKTTKKLRPVYGIGASYDIPQTNFTTNVELTRIQGLGNVKTSASAIPNADLFTVNFSYNFS